MNNKGKRSETIEEELRIADDVFHNGFYPRAPSTRCSRICIVCMKKELQTDETKVCKQCYNKLSLKERVRLG